MDNKPSSPDENLSKRIRRYQKESELMDQFFDDLMEDITHMGDNLTSVAYDNSVMLFSIYDRFVALQKKQAKLIASLKEEEETLRKLSLLLSLLSAHSKFLD